MAAKGFFAYGIYITRHDNPLGPQPETENIAPKAGQAERQ